MTKIFVLLFSLLVLSGCSFKAQPNDWKYKSVNAFLSYTKNFLSNNDDLAKSDLKRAIAHAKQGGDISQLSRIYLGKCALNISVGIKDECIEYKEIESLVNDDSLKSYYALITSSINIDDIKNLDSRYKDFATKILNKEYDFAKDNMFEMNHITSKLLGASLISEYLKIDDISKIIGEASYYGYKKSVLYWLKINKEKAITNTDKEMIDKKIKALI